MTQRAPLGFRIAPDWQRPPAALVERLRAIAPSVLADAMGRFHFMDPGIVSRSGLALCGPALTVNSRPGDNLMVHKAIALAQPGDVLVIQTNGNTTSAVFGELLCRAAAAARLAGIVVDGAVRDVEALRKLGFAAFSRSVSPGGCDRDGPGEIGVPIACGNTAVMPGDVVAGDADGVVVVPRELAEQVLERAARQLQSEAARVREIETGVILRPEVDEVLRRKGVIE
jgi:4-hydroxy-4-methyl-2-oxoglutarate aldolase